MARARRVQLRPTRVYTLADTVAADTETLDRVAPLQAQMLEAFRGRDWDRAETLIRQCRELCIAALESCYGLYLARIHAFRLDPPPEDWDGTATADTK